MTEEYNNYGLFRWNEPNILYNNTSNHYSDVYLHTGTIAKKMQWENSVCFTHVENTLKIISNSNHYLHGKNWGRDYNYWHKIYDNIIRNYKEVSENISNMENKYDLDENKTYFYMINAFCFSNSGHDLSTMLDCVDYINKNNITDIIIFKNYKETHNFKLISLLLPDGCNFIELDENKIYKIKNIIIIFPQIYNIFKYQSLIESLRLNISNLYGEKYKHLHNKKIVLMKTNRNKNVRAISTQIHCEPLLLELEKNGYNVIIPEEIDLFELCISLMYANTVVFSTGSIIYTNKIFINPSAKLVFINYTDTLSKDASGLTNTNLSILKYEKHHLTSQECETFLKHILYINNNDS